MPEELHCPQCASANVVFSKKRGIHVCEDCTHEFVPEKAFVSKHLFISYGHDEHATLALRLRDDLMTRGHDVWFDEERLKPGHDWEAFIEKGLDHLAAERANAAVVLLLTPHAVRRPDGYCLNEVARALSRGLRIIPLMVVDSEPPLSICRIQWLDMRECIPIQAKEVFYLPRFERLLKAIEENQLDFEGSQQRLIKALQPLEFEADIVRHMPRFTGRQWVFDKVDAWLQETSPRQRVFWISGGPGVGKTALSAVLSSRYLEVAALHLCKFGHAQKSDPRRVVTSLAYQLSTQLPEYEARLAALDLERLAQDDARTVFDNLLVQPLAKLSQPNRAIVILVDALDEATSNDGRNELASFIASEFSKTPPWLRLVITSRPEKGITAPLQGLNPFMLDTQAESNRADIKEYLWRELAPFLENRPDADGLMDQILEKSEGVFLYVERVCADLQDGNLLLDRLAQFPQGLGGVFWQFFERQFPDVDQFRKDVRPALRAILAAREPLPVEILQLHFSWQEEELRDFTRSLGSLFPVTTEGDREVIKPYHKSLADWLGDEDKAGIYFVNAQHGHELLGNLGYGQFMSAVASLHPYFVRFLPSHLVESRKYNELRQLLSDPKFSALVYERREVLPLGTVVQDSLNKVYAIDALISRRPLHDTYKCHSVPGMEPCALRLTHDSSDEVQRQLNRLMRLEINSPRIERRLGVVRAPSWLGLITEWIDGWLLPSAQRVVKLRSIPEELAKLHAVRIAVEILEGLQTFHRVGVIYGRLSPDSVGFREDGSVALVLAEAGVAEKEASSRISFGSSDYTAPESSAARPTAKKDLSIVAELLLWMLSGKSHAIGASATPTQPGQTAPSDLSARQIVPMLSQSLAAAIDRARSVGECYASAAEMHLALCNATKDVS